jgi:RNA polymerase sigma-70 factor (ECF subfamily)
MENGAAEEAAFDGIVRRYYEKILKFCLYALGGNRSRAEDCTQDIFLILYENMGRLRDYDRIGGWLYKTAGNITKQYAAVLRKERSVFAAPRNSAGKDSEWDGGLDGGETPVELIPAAPFKSEDEKRREENSVARADVVIRERLKPLDGRVLELAFSEKRPLKEVAAALGMGLSAIKSRVSRLRQRINVMARELLTD